MTARKVEIIDQKILFEKLFFKVEEATLRYETFNGGMSGEVRRFNFERGDGAAVIMHDPSADTVVMVEQFRYSTHHYGHGWLLEIPAGMVNPGEDPQATIRREIEEETGYATQTLEHISTFYLTPGGSSERIFLYYTQVSVLDRLGKGGGLIEEQEDLRVSVMKIGDVLPKITSGEIMDAKTIIGLQWLQLNRLAKG